jgi:hypothetical protein
VLNLGQCGRSSFGKEEFLIGNKMIDGEKELEKLFREGWERVRFLLNDPRMGQRPIGKIIREGREIDIFSNCLGALAYCYDLRYEPFNLVSNDGDPICFPIEGRPGFLDSSVFEEMLSEGFERVPSPGVGDVVLFNNENRRPGDLIDTNIGHAGIYLMQTGPNEAFLFEQVGYEREMGIVRRDLKDWPDGTFFTFHRRNNQTS